MIKALRPYGFLILLITLLSVAANGLSLLFPKRIGEYVDAYKAGGGAFSYTEPLIFLGCLALVVLALDLLRGWVSVYASEKIGYDLRAKLIKALKDRSFSYTRDMSGGRLITVMTSDIDAVKNLVLQGISSLLMAIVTLIGVIIFLLVINWKLALVTLSVMPFILVTFAFVFRKLGPLFSQTQINLDKINKTINESIIGASLVRVLDANKDETQKFDVVNKKGSELATKIVIFFSALIPVITFLSSLAALIVLGFGGRAVINGTLSIGEMSAFLSYTSVFIFPFFILGFASTFISRAAISLKRIDEVVNAKDDNGMKEIAMTDFTAEDIKGNIIFKNVTLSYGDKIVLKDISFEIKPHTRTAILGPTGAGKTELLYLMAGLATPTEGEIIIDGKPVEEWNTSILLSKIGMVFQDSIVFNTTLKENVLFKSDADEAMLERALQVSELEGLIHELPQGLETTVSERGTSLSGGQKQRLMLARALAINPAILLLDDFTARVDAGTESRILQNIHDEFDKITLISITQKIEPIKEYDHIIVLMEGELITEGKHHDLINSSVEYQQIYESQMSIDNH